MPGFNNKFEDWIKDFSSLERAHEYMRLTETPVAVPGEKGDLILWRNTIPHAAGKNQSNLPRFVQYVSFNKI
ncbi:Phytanoyl-CoA dioxygenase (PhyH) [compost metagenome]